ncbi:Cx9C motif-containing protein 4, mitochondrial [Fulvia fulva]|uniref:Cx9C motif-containing protein 4, mitochondrial n=1 Tax=Passalora fulva TaxID=5499 RepID=A0A9Q8L4G1_PASFU|nr:Cx9C motif-containing protein 4, mitochondrial [Fulvia fulva]KAK4636120.1 Cx9C motif-containing protein 4, mitochondrial [Fulvia fulva]KAK4636587.1 Cx9C motif-containing protein 4, mitochondrial [Fulvia fulva]UJO10746.1 Cx9C motif-containing protein 4, mitochondrial [Fulvia fulva]WPV08725.1 Cx9C motif-containing protein 4, mitochondrial [Fulvia fulva]WPV23130.1 Cx9C motif-containing protein 4, mitochondrial [Fulvia fulva]
MVLSISRDPFVSMADCPQASEPKEGLKSYPACHSQACAIQDCIQKNDYKEEKCQKQVDALYACCNLFYKENGDGASTVSCPKANLLRLKMKQRSNGIK